MTPYEQSLHERAAAENIAYRRTIDARSKNWPAIFKACRRMFKRGTTMSNQELAMHLMQCGSTYGWRFCRENGIDPEGRK